MAGQNGVQTSVGAQPAPAVAGDFASANPRFFVLAGPGGLVAGADGVTIGRFAWWDASQIDTNNTPKIVNSYGNGQPTGFVHREQQGLITAYLADAGMTIPEGFALTLMSGGDFWVVNDGDTEALVGQKAYASFADGSVSFAAANTPSTASATGSIAAGAGASFTASISDNVMTVTAVGSGTIQVGGIISGAGVATGTQILEQLSGIEGGVGTYAVSIPEQDVDSTTITETWGVFTAASALSGLFGAGMPLSGTDVDEGQYIVSQLTGSEGGLGTYLVPISETVGSTTITAGTNIETKYYAMSAGLPGELVKISSQPLG